MKKPTVQDTDLPRRGMRVTPKAGPDAEAELESKIGGHWLNRIGILALLIGASYFLKYAFDNEWIGPAGRIVIGLVAGMAVVFWSEHVRRSGYAIFSYSLKAIGIGVLYLSLWASSQLYNLISNALAFFAMAAVTASTVGMALWQDAEIIAAFAALGAFITPLALSTGVNNAAGLFSYLFILDVGALILIRYRPWPRVLMGSYLGTLILYSSWHSSFYSVDQFSTGLMLVGFWNESRFIRWQALILIGATVFKVFLYDTSSLDRGYRILSFITLGLILLATSFLYQRSSRAERSG